MWPDVEAAADSRHPMFPRPLAPLPPIPCPALRALSGPAPEMGPPISTFPNGSETTPSAVCLAKGARRHTRGPMGIRGSPATGPAEAGVMFWTP